MYRIEVDAAHELIEVVLGGMMTIEDVDAYIVDLRRAMLNSRLSRFVMLIDVSACPIQSQEMIRAMGEHMAAMPKAHRIAVVTGSSLARMQVRRLFKQPYARVVTSASAGRAWATDGFEPAT